MDMNEITMHIKLLFLVLLSAPTVNGITYEQAQDTTPIPLLTVCQVLSNPTSFDGKIIQVQGRVVTTDEGSAFIDDSCRSTFQAGGKLWPTAISWTMPSAYCRSHSCVPDILHPIHFSYDWNSDKRVKKKYKKLRNRVPERCIEFRYTGMFEVWSKEAARRAYKNGWIERSGFGHLNSAGAQLILKSADSVSAAPHCHQK